MRYKLSCVQYIAVFVVSAVFSCHSGNQTRVLIDNVDGDKLTQKMSDFIVNNENSMLIDLRGFDMSGKLIGDADLFIDTMWYVPLETSKKYMIGETEKIELDHQSVFVFDRFNAKALFRFALSGEFLNQIGKKGNGPGEYADITDFSLVDNNVAIYDHYKKKILYYKKDGTFLYDKFLPLFCSQFVYMSSGQYLFYTFSEYNHHIPNIRNYNIILCDSSFNIVRRGAYVDKDNDLGYLG